MTEQLAQWQGDFGTDYTQRVKVDPATRVDWFRRTLGPLGIKSVIEAGTNRGHNLVALTDALGGDVEAYGIEPNPSALAKAREAVDELENAHAWPGDIYHLGQAEVELALTSGCLIHVPPERLDEALGEMHRVATRFLLAIEYHSAEDTEVEYRGEPAMLWRRDYGKHYLRLFPDLRLKASGAIADGEGFGGATFWLLEKTQA